MADDSDQISQDEIEKLLAQSKSAKPDAPAGGQLNPNEVDALVASGGKATAAEENANNIVSQSDIEALLAKKAPPVATAAPPKPTAPPASVSREPQIQPADLEFLLNQATQALASVDQPDDALPPNVLPFKLDEFGGAPASTEAATLDLIRDVELDLRIELGRTEMYLEDVLKLRKGSVVPLDKLAGDPVDIYVNGRLVARGEVLVLNDNFCVRVAELIAGEAAAAG